MFDSFNQYFEFFTFLSENCVVSNSTTYVDPALMFQAKEEGKFKLIMFALGIRQWFHSSPIFEYQAHPTYVPTYLPIYTP